MSENQRETHSDRLLRFARDMRKNPTSAEKWLWSCLRGRRCQGTKFYRQRRIGNYIADFVCEEPRLIIELDGSGHDEKVDYDSRRKAYLECQGYTVLRIGSEIKFSDPDEILPFIAATIRRIAGEPSP